MAVYHGEINIKSKGENDIIDITDDVQEVVFNSGLIEGICNIFVAGSTGTISTIEYEPGLKQDIPRMLEKIAPRNQEYKHHLNLLPHKHNAPGQIQPLRCWE